MTSAVDSERTVDPTAMDSSPPSTSPPDPRAVDQVLPAARDTSVAAPDLDAEPDKPVVHPSDAVMIIDTPDPVEDDKAQKTPRKNAAAAKKKAPAAKRGARKIAAPKVKPTSPVDVADCDARDDADDEDDGDDDPFRELIGTEAPSKKQKATKPKAEKTKPKPRATAKKSAAAKHPVTKKTTKAPRFLNLKKKQAKSDDTDDDSEPASDAEDDGDVFDDLQDIGSPAVEVEKPAKKSATKTTAKSSKLAQPMRKPAKKLSTNTANKPSTPSKRKSPDRKDQENEPPLKLSKLAASKKRLPSKQSAKVLAGRKKSPAKASSKKTEGARGSAKKSKSGKEREDLPASDDEDGIEPQLDSDGESDQDDSSDDEAGPEASVVMSKVTARGIAFSSSDVAAADLVHAACKRFGVLREAPVEDAEVFVRSPESKRTGSLLLAWSREIPVVSIDWLVDSISAGRIFSDWSKYKEDRTSPTTAGLLKRSRIRIVGNPMDDVNLLRKLISQCGGRIVSRKEDLTIVGNGGEDFSNCTNPVNLKFLADSVEQRKLLIPDDYRP